MYHQNIAVLGCGNLGQAIIHGLLSDPGIEPGNLFATRRHIEHLAAFRSQGVQTSSDNTAAVAASEVIILAVKPYNVMPVLDEIRPSLQKGRHLLISVATGISTRQMREALPEGIPIIRAMPNTAADVGESVTCLCHEGAEEKDIAVAQKLFSLLGTTVNIDESLMEAATALGACGIAYVLRFIRAMIQSGIQVGFDATTATAIVTQTVKGAAELLITKGTHPESEIDKVTTPKGCTIVGLNEMEHAGFSSALIRGIVASYREIEP